MQRFEESELSRPPSEVLDIICKLGKGSYGSVFKARYKATGGIVAVKKVPVDSDLSDIVKEISIMQQCDSPFIVKCYGSLFDSQDLWICMEYCGAGSIADIMRLRSRTLQEEEIATVLQYSLRGLDYLHQMRKIHRDIKAGNILLLNCGTAKLADFGVAGQLSDTLAKRNTVIGTPYWMAPEVIQEIGYNCSADIWSLGITAIEMADGKPPLADIHPMRALFMIPSQPAPTLRKPTAWSVEFRAFVATCLAKTPEARPTAAALLQTEFIRLAQSRTVLLPLINEANAVREKRLQDAQTAEAMRSEGLIAQQRAKPVEPGLEYGAGANYNASGSEAVDIDDSGDTMVRRSTAGSSLSRNRSLDAKNNSTLFSVGSSVSGSEQALQARRTGDAGGTDSCDGLGTMVINHSEDEEDTGSVVVHGTTSSAELARLGRGQELDQNSGSGANDQASLHVGADGTLTRKGIPANRSDANSNPPLAAAANLVSPMQQAEEHPAHVAPPPAGFAQRPFAPFSRALQESGLFPGGPTGLTTEPGCLTRLSYSELQRLLVNLSNDLETELRNLAIRYRHKRQPLLDAIAEKTAQSSKARQQPAA